MSSNPRDTTEQNIEESMFDGFAQRLVDHFMPTHSTMVKKFEIERMKVLGATTFEETTNPADAEKWMSLIEKCFGVM